MRKNIHMNQGDAKCENQWLKRLIEVSHTKIS